MPRNIHHNVMRSLDMVSDTIKWWGTDVGRLYGQGFMESITESSSVTFGDPKDFAKYEAYRLSHSPLYWVERDMVDLLLSAVKTFPAKRLWPEDLPSPSGFVMFEKPIFMPDRNGKNLNLKGFGWHRSAMSFGWSSGERITHPGGALSLSFYSDSHEVLDDINQELWSEAGAEAYRRWSPPLSLYHHLPWSFGTVWRVNGDGNYSMIIPMVEAEEGVEMTQEILDASFAEYRREREGVLPDGAQEVIEAKDAMVMGAGWYPLVDCLWTLLQQRITHIGSHRPDRHTARRVKKFIPDPQIQIVTLRRATPVTHGDINDVEPQAVDWSCRWIVEGFWRWQWYPSLGQHRRIWIEEYIKGPEDKPLVVKDKVYAWRR